MIYLEYRRNERNAAEKKRKEEEYRRRLDEGVHRDREVRRQMCRQQDCTCLRSVSPEQDGWKFCATALLQKSVSKRVFCLLQKWHPASCRR